MQKIQIWPRHVGANASYLMYKSPQQSSWLYRSDGEHKCDSNDYLLASSTENLDVKLQIIVDDTEFCACK